MKRNILLLIIALITLLIISLTTKVFTNTNHSMISSTRKEMTNSEKKAVSTKNKFFERIFEKIPEIITLDNIKAFFIIILFILTLVSFFYRIAGNKNEKIQIIGGISALVFLFLVKCDKTASSEQFQKMEYDCLSNMKKIQNAVDTYNKTEATPMKNLDIEELINKKYLTKIPKCPRLKYNSYRSYGDLSKDGTIYCNYLKIRLRDKNGFHGHGELVPIYNITKKQIENEKKLLDDYYKLQMKAYENYYEKHYKNNTQVIKPNKAHRK